MKILDLYCGNRKYKDSANEVIGMDKFLLERVDVVHDIEKYHSHLKMMNLI